MRKVSIGIHLSEEPQRLYATIDSLRVNTTGDVEMVLLPDGPDLKMRHALRSFSDFTILQTEQARGAPACFNRLASFSDARVVVLLESGAQPGPRWLDHLLRGLDADAQNGLAGPSTNICWNAQGAFAHARANEDNVAEFAAQAEARFANEWRTLEP